MNSLGQSAINSNKHSMKENEFFWKRERKIDEFVLFIVEKYFMTLYSAHIIFGLGKRKIINGTTVDTRESSRKPLTLEWTFLTRVQKKTIKKTVEITTECKL